MLHGDVMDADINRDDQSGGSQRGAHAFRRIDISESIAQVGDNNSLIVNITAVQATQPVPLPRGGSPYRGLDAFQEDDSDYFFGREEATKKVLGELAGRLNGLGLLVVSGASGAGKSSLLQAGVLPRLRRDGLPGAPVAKSWPHLAFTPTSQPLDVLATQVAGLMYKTSGMVRHDLAMDPKVFALIAREAVQAQLRSTADQMTGRLILVIDQFEQVFTSCADETQRRNFIDALHAAATSRGPGEAPAALIVVGVRADFETRCAQYSELTDAIQHRYLLPPITGRQLRNVITGPAEKARVHIEEGLTSQLLGEIGALRTDGATGTVSSPGVLPLLSHALDQTWRVHKGDFLTLSDYEETGGIEQAVERSATAAYSSLTDPQQKITRQVFIMLTSVSADNMVTSNPRTKAELSAGIAGAQEGDLETVLDAFAQSDRRLLTLSEYSVAIAHEVLIQAWPLLRDNWLAEDLDNRKVRTALRDAVTDWARNEGSSAYLYTGSRLEVAVTATAHSEAEPTRFPRLSHDEEAFLAASRRLEQHRTRQRNGLIAVLTALVVALALIAVWAKAEQYTASTERDASTSGALDARSQPANDSDPVLSRQEALAAWAIKPANSVADSTILDEAANQWSAVLDTNNGSREGWVAFSPNGKFLAARTDDGTHLWNATTHKELTTYLNGNGVGDNSIAFSPDGKVLATVDNSNAIGLWSTAFPYGETCWEKCRLGVDGELYSSVTFNPLGNLVAAAAGDGIQVWNVAAKYQPLTFLSVSDGNIESIAFSPNGKYLVATTENGIDLWNISPHWDKHVYSKPTAVLSVGNDGDTVGAPTFNWDSSQLAVAVHDDAAADDTIQIWSKEHSAWQQTNPLDIGSGTAVYSAAFSPDSQVLAAATSNGVQFWGGFQQAGTLTYQQTSTLTVPSGATAYSAAFSPDGKVLAAATSNGIWLADTATATDSPNGFPRDYLWNTGEDPAYTVALNPDGSLLAIAFSSGGIQMVNTITGRQVPLPDGGDSVAFSSDEDSWVAFSPDGDLLAAATSNGIWLWRRIANRWEKYPNTPLLGNESFSEAAFSPDGEYLAAVSSNSILVWRTGNFNKTPRSLAASEDNTNVSVAFSPDGKLLAATSENGETGTIQEWKTGTFSPVAHLPPPVYDEPDNSVAFSPSGSLLAVGGGVTTQLLNPTTLQPTTLPSIIGSQTAFSPDGLVIGVEDDKEIELRDIDTDQVVNTLPAPGGFGNNQYSGSIVFSANGEELAAITGQDSNEIQLWDVSYLGTSPKNTVSYLCNQLAGQSFTPAEWSQYAPGVPYQDPCSPLPQIARTIMRGKGFIRWTQLPSS